MLTVTLKDTFTGKVKEYPDTDISVFQWTEHNWSCDCNREIAFLEKGQELNFDKPCTSGRFTVVDAEGDFETLTKEEFIRYCK